MKYFLTIFLVIPAFAQAYDAMDCVNDAVKVYSKFNNGLVTRLCKNASNSEPAKCFRDISAVDDSITIGISVDVCSGTTNASKTVDCYGKAWNAGISRGQAKNLCAGASTTEPLKCFVDISNVDKEIPMGIATDVCSGSTNASRTVSCYSKAASSMNRGLATTLCSAKLKDE